MGNPAIDRVILTLVASQAGAIAVWQVVDGGGNRDHMRTRERSGEFRRVRRGLYVHTAFPDSWHQRLWLEVLAGGEGCVVANRAASGLHGFRRSRPGVVEVQRREGTEHKAVFGMVYETFWLPPEHIVRIDGLPVTSVARTVFDRAGHPSHPLAFQNEVLRANHVKEMTWLVNHAIRDHGMRMLELERVLASTGRRGKPGSAIIRQIVADLGVDYAPTATELEELFLEFCDAWGIRRPDEQIDMGTEDRWIGRVDCVWRRERLIVEVDGKQHSAPLDRRADRARDCAFYSVGLEVIRVTRWELVHEPDIHAARIREALVLAA